MRTIWNGSISFGLVSIPVGLAPATKPAARQSDVSFQACCDRRTCLNPIQQKRWCPVHEVEVGHSRSKPRYRGWEVANGQYVPVEDAGARGAR